MSFDINAEISRALQFHQTGNFPQAEEIYRKVLQVNPNHPDAIHLLGVIAHQTGKNDIAVQMIQKAIAIFPNNPGYYSNLGAAWQVMGDLESAASCYRKSIQISPDHVACYNLSLVLRSQGNLPEAIAFCQQALKIKPDYAEAWQNLGSALKYQGKPEQAMQCFRKAMELKPDYDEAYCRLVHQLQYACAWEELESAAAKLDSLTDNALKSGKKPVERPFENLTRHADPARNFAIAKVWAADVAANMKNLHLSFSFDDRRTAKEKIVIAYLSNDFHNHATAHLLLSIFALHDRKKFSIFCYSYGEDDGSRFRKQIAEDADQFFDIRLMSHGDAAKKIYADQVDILVELKGYTKSNRLGICALRPAPVQVTYLGFPGTTGADFLDYFITDRIVSPETDAPYFSEKLVWMPHCYQANDHQQKIAEKQWKKADFGLPENSFVFCSFNQSYKIEPDTFDLWMSILRKVPRSVLWLMNSGDTAKEKLGQEAEKRQVQRDRLFFGEHMPKDEHLARYKLTDLALDTRTVNGHTTTSDALWSGVPVITLKGKHFASRVSASILTAIGLPEIIAHTPEEYERIALHLANHPEKLDALRKKLAKNRLKKPLFDTSRFVKNLEKAYAEMWKKFLSGQEPAHIQIKENLMTRMKHIPILKTFW